MKLHFPNPASAVVFQWSCWKLREGIFPSALISGAPFRKERTFWEAAVDGKCCQCGIAPNSALGADKGNVSTGVGIVGLPWRVLAFPAPEL